MDHIGIDVHKTESQSAFCGKMARWWSAVFGQIVQPGEPVSK